MEGVKKTTTWKGVCKGLQFHEGQLVDENGEIFDLIEVLKQVYEDKIFDISISSKEEELIEINEELVI